MKPSGSSSNAPETKKYLSEPRERKLTIAQKKGNEQAAKSLKADTKKAALKAELAKRKAQADAEYARKPGESAEAHKKRVAKARYGNPVE